MKKIKAIVDTESMYGTFILTSPTNFKRILMKEGSFDDISKFLENRAKRQDHVFITDKLNPSGGFYMGGDYREIMILEKL